MIHISLYIRNLSHNRPILLRLVREAEIDPERRVDIALKLALLGEVFGVVVEDIEVLAVQVDNLEVLLDALGGHRLGNDGASAGD